MGEDHLKIQNGVIDMSNIKCLDLLLENYECVQLQRTDILYFEIKGFTPYDKSGCGNAQEIFLTICARANKLDAYVDDFYEDNDKAGRELPFDRIIRYHDVAVVKIIFSDDIKNCVYANWCEVGIEEENLYHTNRIDGEGNLRISISSNTKA